MSETYCECIECRQFAPGLPQRPDPETREPMHGHALRRWWTAVDEFARRGRALGLKVEQITDAVRGDGA